MGVPKEKKREKGEERSFKEIIAVHSLNLGKDIDFQVEELKGTQAR